MIESYLHHLLSNDPNEVEEAIIQLGESQDPKAVAPLVRSLLRFEGKPELKALVCDALGELNDLRATQALLSQLRDSSEEVRDSAFSALFSIGESRANAMPNAELWAQGFAEPQEALTQIAWQTDLEAVQLLLRALDEADDELKIAALYTLGQLGFVGALVKITPLLYSTNPEVTIAAVFALGELARLGSHQTALQVCQNLHQAWSHGSLTLEAQIQVLRASAECHSLSAQSQHLLAELFVLGLEHTDSTIRQLAVIGLGRLGDDRAVPMLANRLQDQHMGVRRNAAYALAMLHSPNIPYYLVQNILDQPSEVRTAIQVALSKCSHEKSLNAVYEAVNSSDARYRAASVYLLGSLKDEKGLLKTLQDEDSEVRKSSALAVGSAKLFRLSPILLSMLDDPEWRVRAAVSEGLKRLQDPKVSSFLKERRQVESHPVVISALESAISSLNQSF